MIVLLDFDDTLSEFDSFLEQFTSTLATLLTDKLGGSPEEWNRKVLNMMIVVENDYIQHFIQNPLAGYRQWLPTSYQLASEFLFDSTIPLKKRERIRLLKRVRKQALLSVNACFPGMIQLVKDLHNNNVQLVMASGNDSEHLNHALKAAGILNCFSKVYGPDLIDCAKEGPEYYARICDALSITPDQAVVVDNDAVALGWAADVGMKTVHLRILSRSDDVNKPLDSSSITAPEALMEAIRNQMGMDFKQ